MGKERFEVKGETNERRGESRSADWNRNIRGSLKVNNNQQRLLDEVKIFAPNSLQPPPRNIFCVVEFSYEAQRMDELCLTRGEKKLSICPALVMDDDMKHML